MSEFALFLIPGLPLLACVLIAAVALRPRAEQVAPAFLIAALAGSLWLSIKALASIPEKGSLGVALPWISLGSITFNLGALVDHLSGVMLVVVSLVTPSATCGGR